ncbi:MAG TPA: DUF1285 domain-containing protein [Candidatus Binataceae bacterium]|nr:DUF1285 domain-containing protein [Candidatus Binataceae bacterium]
MARAGFYAVESGKISFRRDGHWYSDDERIDNPRIAALFSRSIRQDPDGNWYLQVAEERAAITVEDTPYVVRTIEHDADGAITMLLNDGEHEPLDPATLEVGADNVLYCGVKSGRFRARFLRPAYYHLSRSFEAEGDRFFIRMGDRRYPLRTISSSSDQRQV